MIVRRRNGSMDERGAQLRYMAQSVRLEESVSPRLIRSTMLLIALSLLVFVAWASQARVDEVARANGEVVPQGRPQTLQHLEGGIVESINVTEGQLVERGDILVVFSGYGLHEDMERALQTEIALRVESARLRAFVEGNELDLSHYETDYPEMVADQMALFRAMIVSREEERTVLQEQIAQRQYALSISTTELDTARSNLAIATDLYQRRASLAAQGYHSEISVLETERELNRIRGQVSVLENERTIAEGVLRETQARLDSLDAGLQNGARERLAAAEAGLVQIAEEIDKLADRIQRLDVRAPARGLITGVGVNTVGAVIQPGETLMQLVPLDRPLVAQLSIPPRHIGHIESGQPVALKFSTFDPSQYGTLAGTLGTISASTLPGDRGEPYYHAEVILAEGFVGSDPTNRILPGMTVSADIVTGEKTILDYLLKPIQRSVADAFTER